ncbi:MAG: histidine phosphatase family protein [Patescibacteria group bacterium]
MKIFVIRHGETDLNKTGILQGQRQDAELNESGREQAKQTLQALPEHVFTICFSSPLKRARQTAEIIAEHFRLPIIFRDELKEKDYGSLSGKSFEEVKKVTGVDRTTMNTKLDLTPWGGGISCRFRKTS